MIETESAITFLATDETTLEGRIAGDLTNKAVVLAHPHPLYGGNMDNNVVCAARDACLELGMGTLRFNFRGVGASQGRFDDGCKEAGDILGAIDYLNNQHGTHKSFIVAYSFGTHAFLSAIPAAEEGIEKVILVSPPVSFMDFSTLSLPSVPTHIVVGEQDGYCDIGTLERWAKSQGTRTQQTGMTCLPGVDHFFGGKEDRLAEVIRSIFSE